VKLRIRRRARKAMLEPEQRRVSVSGLNRHGGCCIQRDAASIERTIRARVSGAEQGVLQLWLRSPRLDHRDSRDRGSRYLAPAGGPPHRRPPGTVNYGFVMSARRKVACVGPLSRLTAIDGTRTVAYAAFRRRAGCVRGLAVDPVSLVYGRIAYRGDSDEDSASAPRDGCGRAVRWAACVYGFFAGRAVGQLCLAAVPHRLGALSRCGDDPVRHSASPR
jgi:hypothetical protein